MKQLPTPIGQALERLQSTLEPASRRAKAIRSIAQGATPDAVSTMIAKEPAIRDAISQSCLVWIQSNEILVRASEDAEYFYDRLHYGETLLEWIKSGGCEIPSQSVEDVLRWLLIDSWPQIGVALWKGDVSPI